MLKYQVYGCMSRKKNSVNDRFVHYSETLSGVIADRQTSLSLIQTDTLGYYVHLYGSTTENVFTRYLH